MKQFNDKSKKNQPTHNQNTPNTQQGRGLGHWTLVASNLLRPPRTRLASCVGTRALLFAAIMGRRWDDNATNSVRSHCKSLLWLQKLGSSFNMDIHKIWWTTLPLVGGFTAATPLKAHGNRVVHWWIAIGRLHQHPHLGAEGAFCARRANSGCAGSRRPSAVISRLGGHGSGPTNWVADGRTPKDKQEPHAHKWMRGWAVEGEEPAETWGGT